MGIVISFPVKACPDREIARRLLALVVAEDCDNAEFRALFDELCRRRSDLVVKHRVPASQQA